jgi:hypothetical protein
MVANHCRKRGVDLIKFPDSIKSSLTIDSTRLKTVTRLDSSEATDSTRSETEMTRLVTRSETEMTYEPLLMPDILGTK